MQLQMRSDIGHVLLDVLLEFGAVGPVGGEDDLALQRDHDLGFGGGVELWQVEGLHLLLIEQDDVHTLLELVDDAGLQVLVEWHERLAVPAPGGVHVDDEQLGVLVVVVGEEVLRVADGGRQLDLLALGSHRFPYLSYNNSKLSSPPIKYNPPLLPSYPPHPPSLILTQDRILLYVQYQIPGLLQALRRPAGLRQRPRQIAGRVPEGGDPEGDREAEVALAEEVIASAHKILVRGMVLQEGPARGLLPRPLPQQLPRTTHLRRHRTAAGPPRAAGGVRARGGLGAEAAREGEDGVAGAEVRQPEESGQAGRGQQIAGRDQGGHRRQHPQAHEQHRQPRRPRTQGLRPQRKRLHLPGERTPG